MPALHLHPELPLAAFLYELMPVEKLQRGTFEGLVRHQEGQLPLSEAAMALGMVDVTYRWVPAWSHSLPCIWLLPPVA